MMLMSMSGRIQMVHRIPRGGGAPIMAISMLSDFILRRPPPGCV